MKYNLNAYNKAVAYYKKAIKEFGSKNDFFVLSELKDNKAFYALAPLSQAIHELNNEMYAKITENKKKDESIKILKNIWQTFKELKTGKKDKKTIALKDFIEEVNKKAKNNYFESLFKEPEVIIEAEKNYFKIKGKNKEKIIDFKINWFKNYKRKKLQETCKKIIEQYNPKKNEVFSVGFELMPAKKELELPLEDYLDNFAIAYVFALEAKKKSKVVLASSTSKPTKLTPMERISDLLTTIAGCEYEKKIKEKVFIKFAKLSKLFKINKLKFASCSFSIHGKGYAGKHFFGLVIGYPDPKRKTRWNNVSAMRLKTWWNPQSRIDERKPTVRLAITETLPIDNFIRTCNIDYKMLNKKNLFIKRILEKSNTLYVKAEKEIAGYKTDFSIDLKPFKKGLRELFTDEGKVNELIDKEKLKKFNVKVGLYGNFPAGECFMTPQNINGRMVSDVVINIDRSYIIPKNKPIVIDFNKGYYSIVSAPQFIKNKIKKELNDARKLIKEFEKNKSLPKKIIEEYKKNFKRVGEFSINTSPKARLSRYLIETEKMAKMMHVAIGSGFEPGTQTVYHWDTVINSVNQKINVFAVDEKGRKHFIIKKGKMNFKE